MTRLGLCALPLAAGLAPAQAMAAPTTPTPVIPVPGNARAEGPARPAAPAKAMVISGNARFTVLTPEMIRIEYSPKGAFEDRATFAIQNRDLGEVPHFTTSEDKDFLYISTDKLKLKYRKGTDPLTSPASPDNLTIDMKVNGKNVRWYPGKPDPQNLKGTTRTLDRNDGDSYRNILENGLVSRSGWAVINDSWSNERPDGSHSFALEPSDEVGFDWWTPRADKDALDLYFMGYGHDYKKAMGDFTRVAGKIPLPPDYVLGYWYSRYKDYTDDEFRQIMANLKDNKLPADVIILDMDWHWNGNEHSQSKGFGGWTGWSWNYNLIPHPEKLLEDIHDGGYRVALNLHPADGVSRSESPRYFHEMKDEVDPSFISGDTIKWSLYDKGFKNAFFNHVIRDHEREGVDFWWLDWQQWLTEPKVPGLGETFWCNHVWFNDMKKNRPDRRPVIFHRWGGLGSHRYQIGFSGDTYINFPTLAFLPYFTATASNLGYTYWGHDIGGHMFKDPEGINDPELVLRWLQMGVFTPVFRTHASCQPELERRIWKFPNFPLMREAVNLRYELFPYIYTMARNTYETGVGICRPLYYEYPETENAYKYEGEYFFGDNILVAPVTEAAPEGKKASKKIWFPQGEWWSASTSELIKGSSVKTMEFSDSAP